MKAIATVSLDLPIRIQVPEDATFAIHLPDGPCELRFTEKPAPARADGMRAEGFDDGKGTYVRSTATATFNMEITETLPLTRSASDQLQEVISQRAWDYLNVFIRAYSYVSHHLESLTIMGPESYHLRLTDPDTERMVDGFPVVSGHVLPGPLAVKATLTEGSLAQLHVLLQPDSAVPLPDAILLRAETEVHLHHDLDHAILDVASALEIFVDQLIEQEIHYAPDPSVVRRLRKKGIYSAYDEVLRVLGRPSLKNVHPLEPPEDRPLAFEFLEFIWVVRNNIIHRGVRQFTLDSLNTPRYRSPYLDRHRRHDGLMVNNPKEVLGLVEGARNIIGLIRTAAVR